MGRAPCCDKTSVKRGPWSLEEDSKLKDYIDKHGTGGNWIALPHKAGLNRCGKSCRLRWLNYLRPNLKHGDFSDEEDRIICSLYVNIGSRWSIIAAQLPGRTDNDIKNYWNTKLKKKLMGLLPITTHNHRKLPFPSSFQNQTSPSSIIYTTDYCGHTSFTSLQHISLPASNNNNNNYANSTCCTATTSVSLPPFYQNQDVSLSVPMQYNYPMRDNNILMFGSEGSCSSSSDGSFKEIKQEEIGYQNYISTTGFEDYNNNNNNNNFMLSCNGGGGENSISQYVENSGGVGYNDQTLTPLDYSLEDINQLISSSSNNIDENKTEEKAMYCYYYL